MEPWVEADRYYLKQQEDEFVNDLLYASDEAKSLLESAIDTLIETSTSEFSDIIIQIKDVIEEIKDYERDLKEDGTNSI